MTDLVPEAIENVMKAHNIPFAIYVSKRGQKAEIGDSASLKHPDFPRALFYDEASTKDMYTYLESNIQPRSIAQGEVKTIIGTSGGSIFAFFLNSTEHVLEHHKYAKRVYKETLCQIENET